MVPSFRLQMAGDSAVPQPLAKIEVQGADRLSGRGGGGGDNSFFFGITNLAYASATIVFLPANDEIERQ